MRALLDTHAFLWWIADSKRLSEPARSALADDTNEFAVSAASAWEIATKFRIGKLPGAEMLVGRIASHIARQGFEELTIRVAEAERAGQLPGPHRDPFDRMLIAQALTYNLAIVSADTVFDSYGARRLW